MLAVSLKIVGTFVLVSRLDILNVMTNWNCPRNVYSIVRDYFWGRHVVMRVGKGEVGKKIIR